ncbi:hypothetical protein [Novosphingobium sp.]|uniref:hypothetical protein n=1 Tax=Novosphingobium sp. TaxID=1874826 RepID=UPI00261C0AD9|nr:hypothetical protein [Novosphingobium sp.]
MTITGNPIGALDHTTQQLVQAARTMAWQSHLDCDAMEHLIRNVSTRAKRTLVQRLITPAAND